MIQKLLLLLLICCTGIANAQDTLYVKSPDSNDSSGGIFARVEVEASFPGGQSAWYDFLSKNIKSDVPIRHKAPAGNYTVIAQFIVDRSGQVIDAKALTNFGYGMEEEVIRVLRKSPRWTPAMQNGRFVKAYRKQPLTFVVEADKKKRS